MQYTLITHSVVLVFIVTKPRIINDFVEPFYGGVIVTFLILKLEEDKEENETISFKSRSPIVIAPVGMETVFRGTIVLVR